MCLTRLGRVAGPVGVRRTIFLTSKPFPRSGTSRGCFVKHLQLRGQTPLYLFNLAILPGPTTRDVGLRPILLKNNERQQHTKLLQLIVAPIFREA
jgi:hypothetical protein